MILAIETGEENASVALGRADSVTSILFNQKRNSEEILAAVDFLVKSRNQPKIECVTVCIGPGSYTGLRVGLALAQGLCRGYSVPLIGISNFIARIFLDSVTDGQVKTEVRLREGESARCDFLVIEDGAKIKQIGEVYYSCQPEEDNNSITAEVLVKAGDKIKEFISVGDSDLQFIVTSPDEPILPLYLKPVQAKTLEQRKK